MCTFPARLAAGVLAFATTVVLAAPAFVTIARSAQLTLAASAAPDGLTLQVRTSAGAVPSGVTDVSAVLDGVSRPARLQADGMWYVPLPGARALQGGRLDVYVVHDGIREVLSGTLPPAKAAAGSGGGLFGAHKQLAWWVLNITIVLIGVLAVSRRMS